MADLTKNIDALSRQIKGLADAIGLMSESKDIVKNITNAYKDKLEDLQNEANITGQVLDLAQAQKDILIEIIESEQKRADVSKDIVKKLDLLKKAIVKGTKDFGKVFESLGPEMQKVIKGTQKAFETILKREQGRAVKLASSDIKNMLMTMDKSGILGKMAKYMTLAFVGLEGSAKRGRVERGIAVSTHPKTFPGEIGGATGLAKLMPLMLKLMPVILSISKIVSMWWENFKGIQAISANLVKSTGATAGNIARLSKDVYQSQIELKYFNIEMSEIIESAGVLTKEFKNINLVQKHAVDTVTILNKMTNISTSQLARFYKILNVNWKLSDKNIRSFTLALRDQAKVYGLDFAGIMQDITANAENLTLLFGGSVKHLKEAAVRAAMMGTSLSTQTQIMFKFAHWADAIQNSFMLSVISGKQINAAFLYTKAAVGDTAGVVDHIMDALGSSADSWKKIVPMAMQVSQTLGVPFEEINTMMENKALEKILSAAGVAAGQMGHALKIVRESTGQGQSTYDVAKSMSSNMSNLSQKISQSVSLEEELTRNRSSELAKTGQEFAKAIGLRETMDPLTQITASMAGVINQIFSVLSNQIAPALEPLANIATWLGKTFGGGIGQLETKLNAVRYMTMATLPYIRPRYATGGITSGPSLAGEAGPEAVLPLSGSGRKTFTEPFVVSSVVSPIVNELKKTLEEFTKTPIEVKVYLDSTVLAEKLDKHYLMTATR